MASKHSVEEAVSKVIRGLSKQAKACLRSLVWMRGQDVGTRAYNPSTLEVWAGGF